MLVAASGCRDVARETRLRCRETRATSASGSAAEVAARVVDEHRRDLSIVDAALTQGRQDILADVAVVPVRRGRFACLGGKPVDGTRRVMREHDALGVPTSAQFRDGVDAFFEGQQHVEAEAVHAEVAGTACTA